MSTYYDMLKVASTATTREVEHAIEGQYNQWRRLITHHDPAIVNQANEAIQSLEVIRGTLMDEGKRDVYDRSIGLKAAIGGLADPAVLLSNVSAPPPLSPRQNFGNQPSQPQNIWSCYRCQTENPPHTKYCFKCTAPLVRRCPECKNETSLIATGNCGTCGLQFEVAEQRERIRQEATTLRQELQSIEKQVGADQQKLAKYEQERKRAKEAEGNGIFIVSLGAVVALGVSVVIVGNGRSGAAVAFLIAVLLLFLALLLKRRSDVYQRELRQDEDELSTNIERQTAQSRRIQERLEQLRLDLETGSNA
ncbi:MAG: hypothetical protein M3R24_05790 [Chloroflexota bacterium]|nr:hypothetical protein [Chloroflexota bacterium]